MIEFIILIVFVYIIFWQTCLIIAQFHGAPSVFADYTIIEEALSMARPTKKQLILDLGCGDARSLILAVKKFDLIGVGIERSPYCFIKAKLMVFLSGESQRITILFGDFNKAEKYLKSANIIYLYLSNMLMEKNEKWLFAHLKKGSKIVSLSFRFKYHKPIEVKLMKIKNTSYHIYLYENRSN